MNRTCPGLLVALLAASSSIAAEVAAPKAASSGNNPGHAGAGALAASNPAGGPGLAGADALSLGPVLAAPPLKTPEILALVHDIKNAAIFVPTAWLIRTRNKLGPETPDPLRQQIDAAITRGQEAEKTARLLMREGEQEGFDPKKKKRLFNQLKKHLDELSAYHLDLVTQIQGLAASGIRPQRWSPENITGVLADSVRQSKSLSERLWGLQGPAHAAPVRFHDAVVLVLEKTSARLKLQNVRLLTDLRAAKSIRVADPAGLERIVLNLVLNAADAVQGSADRIITVRTYNQGNATVVLEVSDTGRGMAPDMLEKIRRGESFTTKGPEQGSGVGLPSVRQKVLENRGTFSVESVPGQGTTFRIELPAKG